MNRIRHNVGVGVQQTSIIRIQDIRFTGNFVYWFVAAFEIAYNMFIDMELARLFEGSSYETDVIKVGLRFSW